MGLFNVLQDDPVATQWYVTERLGLYDRNRHGMGPESRQNVPQSSYREQMVKLHTVVTVCDKFGTVPSSFVRQGGSSTEGTYRTQIGFEFTLH